MFSTITVEELVPVMEERKMTLIDVRSPSEYEEFTIPGSVNIPFFSDEERAEIGTIYKQVSVEAAKERGLEIVSSKLPSFIKEFKNIEGDKTVFCWRGGMRSRTTATLLSLMGIHVNRLDGGIRSYRQWVVSQLEEFPVKKAFVLNGMTGTGKTKILRALQDEGYPVIDLEGMANHRGSIFGHIGSNPNTQKKFDSLLIQRLRELQEAPYVLFEAESRRIGKVYIAPFLTVMKQESTQIIIEMPMEARVAEILEDYRPWEFHEQCKEAFSLIKSRIHTPIAKEIEDQLNTGEYSSAIQNLLQHYYDARYTHSSLQYPEENKIVVKANSIEEAIEAIKRHIHRVANSDQVRFSI
ncbi:tRNA 2-selenouridine(34) synthase MnmH [Chungangia koreensis]|uniref:tRNA 2-selenouridine(34) synthase MnmH n=1 Tax=Chungangia koreensis TaxID=752657 RepID=A0ABV8X9B0_9LACT